MRTGDPPDRRTAAFLRWGLVPAWTREGARPPLLINARSETVATRPAFREALKRRRCLVLADGFFEWSRHGAVRQPYYLTINGGEPFAMAGLWERWQPPARSDEPAREVLETFAIITTAANEVLAPLHDRMPVILEPDFYDDWLNPLLSDTHGLQPLLRPFPAFRMFARAVSPRVNSIRHDDPECLAPLPDPAAPGHAGTTHAVDDERRNGQLDFDFEQ